MKKFNLRFSSNEIGYWSSKYNYYQNDLEQNILDLVPSIKMRRYLLKEEFVLVSKWKSPRTFKHYSSNDSSYIEEVSGIALSTKNEQLRIEAFTLLKGISYPAASVFLHFFHKEKYPIIDFRALWSLKSNVPRQYTFEFWNEYVGYCRSLSEKSGFDMRTIDQSLWAYSKLNQKS